MTRADHFANALVAVGVPDTRCGMCGTWARPLAVLCLEVLDQLEDDVTLAGAELTVIRGERYGPPDVNFARTWHLWQPVIEAEHLTGAQKVALMNLLQKVSRLIETPDDPDSILDVAGYGATLDLLAGREPSV